VLNQLKHPYIIAYKESFENHKALSIVMEYADDGDLHSRIVQYKNQKKIFEEKQILD